MRHIPTEMGTDSSSVTVGELSSPLWAVFPLYHGVPKVTFTTVLKARMTGMALTDNESKSPQVELVVILFF